MQMLRILKEVYILINSLGGSFLQPRLCEFWRDELCQKFSIDFWYKSTGVLSELLQCDCVIDSE